MQCQNCLVENAKNAERCSGCNLLLDGSVHQELALVNRMLRSMTQGASGKKAGEKVVETYVKRRQQLLSKLTPADGAQVKILPLGTETSVEIPTMKLQETEESTRSLITSGDDTAKLPPLSMETKDDTQSGNLLGVSTDELTARTRQLDGAADVTRKLSGDDIGELVADTMRDDMPLASTVRVSDSMALDTQGLESARREAVDEPPPETGNLEATVQQLHRPQPLGVRASGEKKERPETRAAGIYLQKQVEKISQGVGADMDTVHMNAVADTLPLGGRAGGFAGMALGSLNWMALLLYLAGVILIPPVILPVAWFAGPTAGALAGVAVAAVALFVGIRKRAVWPHSRTNGWQWLATCAGLAAGLALSVTPDPLPLAQGVAAGALLGGAVAFIGCLVHRSPLQLSMLVFFACVGLHVAIVPTETKLLEVGYWLPAVYAVLMLGIAIAARGALEKTWFFAAMSGLQSAMTAFMAQFMFFWLVMGDIRSTVVLLVVLCNTAGMMLAAYTTGKETAGFLAAVSVILCAMTLLGGAEHEPRMAVGAGVACAALFLAALRAQQTGLRELAAGLAIGAGAGALFIACMLATGAGAGVAAWALGVVLPIVALSVLIVTVLKSSNA